MNVLNCYLFKYLLIRNVIPIFIARKKFTSSSVNICKFCNSNRYFINDINVLRKKLSSYDGYE